MSAVLKITLRGCIKSKSIAITPPIIPHMSSYTQSIQNLINQFASLPGIGARSAERIAFHLLKQKPEEAMKLAEAISDVKTRIKHCSVCYNLTESDPCTDLFRIRHAIMDWYASSNSRRICWRWNQRVYTRESITFCWAESRRWMMCIRRM